MSSHHIVRDDQEPALIIADGEACSDDLMNQLMEWSPFVLVLDGAIHRVLEKNIKFDAWLGDFDSGKGIEISNMPHLQHVQIIHTPNQNRTDLQKGVEFLIEKGFPAANILWATGKRQDHNFTNLFTLSQYQSQITLSVLDDYSRIYMLPKSFKKWYPKGTQISLIPVGTASGIQSENLVYPLNNLELSLPFRTGSSNEVSSDGFVSISYEKGYLMMMECWDK